MIIPIQTPIVQDEDTTPSHSRPHSGTAKETMRSRGGYSRLRMGRSSPSLNHQQKRQRPQVAGEIIPPTDARSDEDGDGRGKTSRTRVQDSSMTASTSASAIITTTSRRSSLIAVEQSTTDVRFGSSEIRESLASSSFSASTTIYLQSFPPDFPVQTPQPPSRHDTSKHYLFMKDAEVIDSMLIFATIFGSCLLLTITCIKCNSVFSRNKEERRGKVDNVIMEDMKWAEGREVIERKIIWETESVRSGGIGTGKGRGRRSGGPGARGRSTLSGLRR
ncbi:uncharacterized protein I303_105723 [Kwoniella dejecticola CBS 10117]|uniref:Transmembrane protein n=1 Tax=Kwoniella dejecticola CBS 10117 TaxID=1296121 RepID=A0AAJ8KSR2_9TREE